MFDRPSEIFLCMIQQLRQAIIMLRYRSADNQCVKQYDTPQGGKSPELPRSRRWREASRSRSRSRPRSRHDRSSSPHSRNRRRHESVSWSPSGRIYPSTSSSEKRLHVSVMSDSEHARRRDHEGASRDMRHRDRSPEPSSGDAICWEYRTTY